ncbi:ABC transporter permease [Litorihabitans aurantiacus]|uniref:Osmoprotectant (Glycine betaine/ carnitine/choline/l-proline) ABC transporter ProW n=1 Tax=Litorihabitans aurantiacus TaxID=1930061 RepID=A0AA37XFC7_9MICO|nr:ABC transporter permease [Litorihabitans aurantiacus]GMA32236.1 putative osmoprotectant (glycine betaine/ carnitine/choline/l-proline) ABC transporter ProW [Litorihabitans aurantiacus]
MNLWGVRNWEVVQGYLLDHLYLAVVPTVIGVALALPIGLLLRDRRRSRTVAIVISSAIFTIPSLALFVVLPAVIGTRVLDPINVVVALTLYTVALSVRTTFEALDAVPASTREAATAIGYSSWRRALAVDLPLSIPVLVAGTRVVAVTNVSMVSVGAVIGIGGLGQLFTSGYQRDFPEQILTGLVLILALAIVFDRVIALIGRALTPWIRGSSLRASERRLRALAQKLPEVGRLREAARDVR